MQQDQNTESTTPSKPAMSLADEISQPINQIAIVQRLQALNAGSPKKQPGIPAQ